LRSYNEHLYAVAIDTVVIATRSTSVSAAGRVVSANDDEHFNKIANALSMPVTSKLIVYTLVRRG